jgi:hypothetical protein
MKFIAEINELIVHNHHVRNVIRTTLKDFIKTVAGSRRWDQSLEELPEKELRRCRNNPAR